MITKADAVEALKPNAIWTMRGDELEWQDDNITKPTDAEIKKKYDELVAAEPLNEVRKERNLRLQESDWTQNRDVTLSNDADWKTYRQALRDITKEYKSLEDVKWPEKPE